MDNISGYIEQFVLDKLNTFNEGRNTDKGVYFILLPNEKTAYYTLWFYNPAAEFHPNVFLSTLDVNAINSVEKAMKTTANSFARLTVKMRLSLLANIVVIICLKWPPSTLNMSPGLPTNMKHAYKAKDVSRNWQRPIHGYIRT